MEKMLKVFVLLLAVCSMAHGKQTKTRSLSRLRRAADENENHLGHHVVGRENETVPYSEDVARNESAHFVSDLFKHYNSSNRLSLDGFARLLCKLGLIPEIADDTTSAADDILVGTGEEGGEDNDHNHHHHQPLDCGRITFDQVPATFKNLEKEGDTAHEHGNDDHDHGDHDHSDHDHQPNRNSSSSSNGIASVGNHDSDSNHDHNHDHDHDHDHHDGESSQDSGGGSASGEPAKSAGSRSRRDVLSEGGDAAGGAESEHHDHSFHQHKQCPSPKELLAHFNIPERELEVDQFSLLCPALLYTLDMGGCQPHDHDHHDHESEASGAKSIPPRVWGYSIAAVLVISLAGLLGVAAIPIMQKVFYNHLLQFLVAIAVGALSGDALLHLLPHAMAKNHIHHGDEHDHSGPQKEVEEDHLQAVWKGMVALICIFFFFLTERVLTIVTEKKRRKKEISGHEKKHCERLCDAEKSSRVGAKLSAHDRDNADYGDCEQMVMVVHPNRALKGFADATHNMVMHQCDDTLNSSQDGHHQHNNDNDDNHNDDDDDNDKNNSSVSLGGHLHGHSHGHGHGHSHHLGSVPGSVAAVAWMVIFGDGIHNFSDGLAIGAAFASSVTGGISTSIAVFCHELPHEIGDFAVLLRAGMTVKQAIVYNCVSSVLCFMGMLVGVAIGNLSNMSLWIFAGVAGMFIYISMVDMLPEMTAVDTKKGENHFLHLLMQACGMMIGSGIMLIIAIFEHDIQRMLG